MCIILAPATNRYFDSSQQNPGPNNLDAGSRAMGKTFFQACIKSPGHLCALIEVSSPLGSSGLQRLPTYTFEQGRERCELDVHLANGFDVRNWTSMDSNKDLPEPTSIRASSRVQKPWASPHATAPTPQRAMPMPAHGNDRLR